MLKIFFEELKTTPEVRLDLYDSINRIPFSLTIRYSPILSEPIYARNLKDENFIEFRFDKTNKSLYEMSLISVNNDIVRNVETIKINYQKDKLYSCFISEEESKLEDSVSMKIFRDKKSVCIEWDIKEKGNVEYFSLSSNCLFGIDSHSYLTSVVLTNLNREEIFNIFGF